MAVTAASAIFLFGPQRTSPVATLVLTVLTSMVAISLITSTVVRLAVLHQYARACEAEISRLMSSPDGVLIAPSHQLPLYTTVSRRIITFNPRHLRWYSLPFFLSQSVAALSGILAPLQFIVVLLKGMPEDDFGRKVADSVSDAIFPAAAWTAGAIYVIACLAALSWSLMTINLHSSDIFKRALKDALEEDGSKNTDHNSDRDRRRDSVFSYLLWPRPADAIKWCFTLYGLLLGFLWSPEADHAGRIVLLTIFVLFFFEGLAYQSRYQWNDLRGVGEDRKHPLHHHRRRLPSGSRTVVEATVLTAVGRMIIASVLVSLDLCGTRQSGFVGIFLVWAIAIPYEWSRSSGMGKLTYALVGLGYPLRVFVGFWCAWPSMWSDGLSREASIVLVLVLVATYAFGLAFDGLTWAQEGIHSLGEEAVITKPHLRWLTECANTEDVNRGIRQYLESKAHPDAVEQRWKAIEGYCTMMLLLPFADWRAHFRKRNTVVPEAGPQRPHPFREPGCWYWPWNLAHLVMCVLFGEALVIMSAGRENFALLATLVAVASAGACRLVWLGIPAPLQPGDTVQHGARRNSEFVLTVLLVLFASTAASLSVRNGGYIALWVGFLAYICVYLAFRSLNYEEMNSSPAEMVRRGSRIAVPVVIRLVVGLGTWRGLQDGGVVGKKR